MSGTMLGTGDRQMDCPPQSTAGLVKGQLQERMEVPGKGLAAHRAGQGRWDHATQTGDDRDSG